MSTPANIIAENAKLKYYSELLDTEIRKVIPDSTVLTGYLNNIDSQALQVVSNLRTYLDGNPEEI